MEPKSGFDPLVVACYVAVFATLCLIPCAVFLVWENRTSRNLALGFGALLGIMLAFVIQVIFELQASTTRHRVSFAYTFDLAAKTLRQPNYLPDGADLQYVGPRLHTEVNAGQWIFTANPDAVRTDRKKIVTDMTLFSLVSLFARSEYDWQMERKNYRGGLVSGSVTSPVSKPSDCSFLTEGDIRARFRESGNLFADAPVHLKGICLPPDTALVIRPNQLVFKNRAIEVSLTVEQPDFLDFTRPGTDEVPKLKSGDARYETYTRAIDIDITFPALRAYHPSRKKYERWSDSLAQNVAKWFACC